MIRFECGKCGRTIKVTDSYAGKKGKCPDCGGGVRVPGPEEPGNGSGGHHIRFSCGMCDQHVKVAGKLAGKTIECPHCKCYLDVPDENAKKEQAKKEADEALQLKAESASQSSLGEYLENNMIDRNRPVEDKSDKVRAGSGNAIVEAVLYPLSVSGIVALLLFTFGPLALSVISVPLNLSCFGMMISLFFYIAWASYMFWFFSYCVQQSSQGIRRAPQTIGFDEGLGEMFMQMLRILACMAVFILPGVLYRRFVEENTMYWVIYCSGMALFPMALLSVTMHSSVVGLNPVLLIVSIVKTVVHYCIVAVCAMVLIKLMIASNMPGQEVLELPVVLCLNAIYFYLALVLAHVLGRFHYRHADRLDWVV